MEFSKRHHIVGNVRCFDGMRIVKCRPFYSQANFLPANNRIQFETILASNEIFGEKKKPLGSGSQTELRIEKKIQVQ